jgi:hypothetical protein
MKLVDQDFDRRMSREDVSSDPYGTGEYKPLKILQNHQPDSKESTGE